MDMFIGTVFQLVLGSMTALVQLALVVAMLLGRTLAVLFPVLFRAAVTTVRGIGRLLGAIFRRNARGAGLPEGTPARRMTLAPPPRQGAPPPSAHPTPQRRYTPKSYW